MSAISLPPLSGLLEGSATILHLHNHPSSQLHIAPTPAPTSAAALLAFFFIQKPEVHPTSTFLFPSQSPDYSQKFKDWGSLPTCCVQVLKVKQLSSYFKLDQVIPLQQPHGKAAPAGTPSTKRNHRQGQQRDSQRLILCSAMTTVCLGPFRQIRIRLGAQKPRPRSVCCPKPGLNFFSWNLSLGANQWCRIVCLKLYPRELYRMFIDGTKKGSEGCGQISLWNDKAKSFSVCLFCYWRTFQSFQHARIHCQSLGKGYGRQHFAKLFIQGTYFLWSVSCDLCSKEQTWWNINVGSNKRRLHVDRETF